MNIIPLIRKRGFTLGRFASVAGLSETRLNEIIFTDRFTMNEWDRIEKALGMRPPQLAKTLGKAPCDFITERNRKKKAAGEIINITDWRRNNEGIL